MRLTFRYVAAVLLLAGVVLAVVFSGRARQELHVSDSLASSGEGTPVVFVGASEQSWYCIGPSSNFGNRGATLVIQNLSASKKVVRLGPQVGGHLHRLVLGPHETLSQPFAQGTGESVLTPASVLVYVQSANSSGLALLPCSSSPSEQWTIGGVYTQNGDTSNLEVYNPFRTAALIDISGLTANGSVTVATMDGLIVAPGTTLQINLARLEPAESSVAVTLASKSGRVVAAVTVSRQDPRATGTAFVLGQANPMFFGQIAYLPGSAVGQSHLELVNPGSRTAYVIVRAAGYQGSGSQAVRGSYSKGVKVEIPAGSAVVEPAASFVTGNPGLPVSIEIRSRSGISAYLVERNPGTLVPFTVINAVPDRSHSWLLACDSQLPQKIALAVLPRRGSEVWVQAIPNRANIHIKQEMLDLVRPGVVSSQLLPAGGAVLKVSSLAPSTVSANDTQCLPVEVKNEFSS